MAEGNTVGTASAGHRPASLAEALKSPAPWRASSRYALLAVAMLLTFSAIAAAIPALLGVDADILRASRAIGVRIVVIATPLLLLMLAVLLWSISRPSAREAAGAAAREMLTGRTMSAAPRLAAPARTVAGVAGVAGGRAPWGLAHRLIIPSRFALDVAARTAMSIRMAAARIALRALARIAEPAAEASGVVGVPPLLLLARLRLGSMSRLADITRSFGRMEDEARPLLALAAELEVVRRRFAANLDAAMRPLAEFAGRWDESLVTLASEMDDDPHLPRIDVTAERHRIAEIRAQIPQRHALLHDQFEIEKQAIDAALMVFDGQAAQLEAQLAAAWQTAEAIGGSMRAPDFERTVAFLRDRMERLGALAEIGAATPEEIAEALPAAPASTGDGAETAAHSPSLQSVLAALDARRPGPALPPAGRGAA